MVFSSFTFLFRFLPITLVCYFLAPRKLKNLVLFLCSLIFYGWGEPIYIVLMLFSSIVDYGNGLGILHCQQAGNKNGAKAFLILSIIINLGLLFVFKYANFTIDMLNNFSPFPIWWKEMVLPIGISFYTFQTMSYTIDVYRREVKAQKNFITFCTYVSLFPQLIAGPIVRYKTVEKELTNRKENSIDFSYGIIRFVCGVGKKVILANNIGALWNTIAGYEIGNLPMLTAWIGIAAFMFQIYFDFSGYSDMAIGLGVMFGFRFPENFCYPYISKSITEFWRRWHISLSTWFKEYVYIPLGGNRKGIGKQIRNIAIVWILTGLWHGAAWNFCIWGIYFAVLLIGEKLFIMKWLEKIPSVFRHLYALLFILGGWVIFAYPDMKEGIGFIKALFGLGKAGLYDQQTIYLFYTNVILFLILTIGATKVPLKICTKVINQETVIFSILKSIYIVIIFLLSIAYLVDSSYNPFLYFRF